jgi:Ca-activated chloride channel family protein
MGVLAVFFYAGGVQAQSLKDLPPPPPVPTPKPTPVPTPTPEPKAEDLDVVRVNSNLVMVPVSVVDSQGQAVHGLQVPDFRLEEQGRNQKITDLGDPEQVPLDIAILFDVSSSVSQKGFFAFQQAAAASFIKQVLKSTDRAAVFTITDQPRMVQALAPADVAAAKIVAIPPAQSNVPTAFYDTVTAASNYLIANSPERHRRVIVAISDGDDNFSKMVRDASLAEYRASADNAGTALAILREKRRLAVLEVQKASQKADAAFYSVNPGGPSVRLNQMATAAQTAMESIAASTGGTAFLPGSEQDLTRVFNEVAAELRGQYLIQYYSDSTASPGQFRSIKVAVPGHPEFRIRARQGYYPKGQQ